MTPLHVSVLYIHVNVCVIIGNQIRKYKTFFFTGCGGGCTCNKSLVNKHLWHVYVKTVFDKVTAQHVLYVQWSNFLKRLGVGVGRKPSSKVPVEKCTYMATCFTVPRYAWTSTSYNRGNHVTEYPFIVKVCVYFLWQAHLFFSLKEL